MNPVNPNPQERQAAAIARAEAHRDKLQNFAMLTGEIIGASFPIPAEMLKDWTQSFAAMLTGPQDDMIQHLVAAPADMFEPPKYYDDDPPPFDPNELASLELEREQIRESLAKVEAAKASSDVSIQAVVNSGMLDMVQASMTRRMSEIDREVLEIQDFMESKARASLDANGDTLNTSAAPLYPQKADELTRRGILKPGDQIGQL